jgi:hypothetical protein
MAYQPSEQSEDEWVTSEYLSSSIQLRSTSWDHALNLQLNID